MASSRSCCVSVAGRTKFPMGWRRSLFMPSTLPWNTVAEHESHVVEQCQSRGLDASLRVGLNLKDRIGSGGCSSAASPADSEGVYRMQPASPDTRKFFYEHLGINERLLEQCLSAALSAGGDYAD